MGVPTLDCLAGAVLGGGIQVVPFIDAKRNQVYAALYERKNGVLRKKIRERVTPPHSFLKTVRGKTLFLGDGAVLYKDMIRGMLGKRAVLADPAYHVPNPATLVAIGVDRFTKGRLENPYKLIPLYLYPKDCMINKDHLAKVKKLPKAKD